MKTDVLNTGRYWRELQETNDSLIVLDSNCLIVSCNEKAKRTLLQSHSDSDRPFPLDGFLLELNHRVFRLSEFKNVIGKTIKLVLIPSHGDAYRVNILVEAFSLLGQQCYSLLIQKDSAELDVDSLSSSCPMAKALNADLKKNLLELYYQPQINTSDNRLYGVEVLTRWNSKEFGQVAPDTFIAVAENFGFIAELDLWVFRQACQQLAVWRKQNIGVPRVAVNFSPFSFHYPNLKNIIQTILNDNDISADNLVIEVTENRKVKSADLFINIIRDLHSMGINISLDDFGTGYSNFKRLLSFPVSQLKLDRIFVSALPNGFSKELSEAVLFISKKIGAVLIAEGVETQEQFYYLKNIGYEVVQGYFFCQPLSKENLERWLVNKRF